MSTDPLTLHRQAEESYQRLARMVERHLPAGLAFAVVTFTTGAGGYAGYVSNANRSDMIRALRECADKLEAGRDVPRISPEGHA